MVENVCTLGEVVGTSKGYKSVQKGRGVQNLRFLSLRPLWMAPMYCFLPSGFIKVIIFVINLCGRYSRFVRAESFLKVCFGSFGSIPTDSSSVTY